MAQSRAPAIARCAFGATGSSQKITASTVVLSVRGLGGAVGRNGRLVCVLCVRGVRRSAAFAVLRRGATRSRAGLEACPTSLIETTLGDGVVVKRELCTADTRVGTISAESSAAIGSSFGASALLDRGARNAPLRLSFGLRPQREHRASASPVRAPQCLQFIF